MTERKAEGTAPTELCVPHGALWTQDTCFQAWSTKMKACNVKLKDKSINKCTTKFIIIFCAFQVVFYLVFFQSVRNDKEEWLTDLL